MDKEIEEVTDESEKEYAGLVGAFPSKRSASERCEDQIIVAMMKWLSFGYVGMGIYILRVTKGGGGGGSNKSSLK